MSLIRRLANAVVHPTVRLPITTEFPLSGKTLGVAYIVGFFLFLLGSLLPVGLFLLGTFGLMHFAEPETAAAVLDYMFNRDGSPKSYALAGLMASSFIGGFALQMWYLSWLLRRRGHTLTGVIGLSTRSLRGKTPLHTGWAIIWRSVAVFAMVLVVENILGMFLKGPEQPTIQFARSLSDSMWVFFVIAAIGAPLFEEFVFRGVLFQALRSTFHGYRVAATDTTGSAPKKSRIGNYLGRKLLYTQGRAELWSVVVSGAVFALWHMQFHPVQLLLLFGMGCVLAEVFRRTGTLWTAIAVHALNNGLVVLLIMYGVV